MWIGRYAVSTLQALPSKLQRTDDAVKGMTLSLGPAVEICNSEDCCMLACAHDDMCKHSKACAPSRLAPFGLWLAHAALHMLSPATNHVSTQVQNGHSSSAIVRLPATCTAGLEHHIVCEAAHTWAGDSITNCWTSELVCAMHHMPQEVACTPTFTVPLFGSQPSPELVLSTLTLQYC